MCGARLPCGEQAQEREIDEREQEIKEKEEEFRRELRSNDEALSEAGKRLHHTDRTIISLNEKVCPRVLVVCTAGSAFESFLAHVQREGGKLAPNCNDRPPSSSHDVSPVTAAGVLLRFERLLLCVRMVGLLWRTSAASASNLLRFWV